MNKVKDVYTIKYLLIARETSDKRIEVSYRSLPSSSPFDFKEYPITAWNTYYIVDNEFEIQQHIRWKTTIALEWNPRPISKELEKYIPSDTIVAWELTNYPE